MRDPSERIWSNQEAVLLRRNSGGYMLVCTAGRAAFLSDLEAETLRAALAVPESAAVVFAASRMLNDAPFVETATLPVTFTREPKRRNKPKSRKPPKRPYHRKAPKLPADLAVMAEIPST